MTTSRPDPGRQAPIGVLSKSLAWWWSEPIEAGLFLLFIAALAWVPAWYGSNDLFPWAVNAVVFPGLAMLYEASLLLRARPHPVAIRLFALPAGLFLAVLLWIGLQEATWIPRFLANPIWSMTGQALGYPVRASISVNRDLTALAFIRLVTAASAFWLALQLCRDRKRAEFLLLALAVIGTAYAGYGLVLMKFDAPSLAVVPLSERALSSSFFNPDSYATYAAMGLIIVAGLLLDYYAASLRSAGRNLRLQLAFFLEATGRRGAVLLMAALLIAVALLTSRSRGGVFAAVFGVIVLVTLLRRRKEAAPPQILIAIGLALLVATVVAFGNSIAVKLEQGGVYDGNRLSVYLLTLRSISDKPLLGYGYGTFADVFPMYRDQTLGVVGKWSQAHNTYLEIFQGLGVVFGAMLIGSVVLIALRCWKGAIARRRGATVPAVAASIACLVGAHALVDFSLQIQAVTLTFVTILGAGAAQSESSRCALAD